MVKDEPEHRIQDPETGESRIFHPTAKNPGPIFAPGAAGTYPPPGGNPPPRLKDDPRPLVELSPEGPKATEEPVEPEVPSTPLSTKLIEGIDAWRPIICATLMVLFIAAATAGGFWIAHLAMAVGLFCLSGTSLLVAVLLDYNPEPVRGRVRILEEIVSHLTALGGVRVRPKE